MERGQLPVKYETLKLTYQFGLKMNKLCRTVNILPLWSLSNILIMSLMVSGLNGFHVPFDSAWGGFQDQVHDQTLTKTGPSHPIMVQTILLHLTSSKAANFRFYKAAGCSLQY
jgi:hypothetical protein